MNTKLEDLYGAYRGLLGDVGQEFDRVSAIFSDRMQCRKGCSMCCSQLFGISLIEAAYISRGVKALKPDQQEEMRDRAKNYLKELTGVPVVESETLEEHSRAVSAALKAQAGVNHIPCPALEDDACAIYDNRPVIARKWGIPLWNPQKPNILQACELNFKAGEAIQGDGLVEPQMDLEYRWLKLKEQVLGDLNLPDLIATVASAVLFDYEAVLEKAIAEQG